MRTGWSWWTRTVRGNWHSSRSSISNGRRGPLHDVPMQMHLDLTVPTTGQLQVQRERAESLGAKMLLDRTDDADEPLYVFADPSGHLFCIFVA